MTEPTSPPIIVEVVKGLWPYLAAGTVALSTAIGAGFRLLWQRVDMREKRARDDHEADLARQRKQYEAQIAAERAQRGEEVERLIAGHQRELAALDAAFQAHYLTLRDAPLRQDKIVARALEMADRVMNLAPVPPAAIEADTRPARRRSAP